MCLRYNKKSTEDFWNTEDRKDQTWCWATKLYRVDEDTNCLVSPYRNIVVKPGWIKSNRFGQKVLKDTGDYYKFGVVEINRGIYVIVGSYRPLS